MVFKLPTRRLCCALTFAGLLAGGVAVSHAGNSPGATVFAFGPNLSASGWTSVKFPWKARANFSPVGQNAVAVSTSGGVGLLWRPVPANAGGATNAEWRWRKTQGVGPTDLTRKGGDDRVLALYFAFADPADVKPGTDLTELMRNGRGDVLVYVWGGAAKRGSVLPLPYFDGRGRTIVKQEAGAKPGVWFNEQAGLRADFQKAFGKAPGRLVAVAVSSDADDTRGRNVAVLADLCVK